MQQPVVVNSVEQLVKMVPAWANVYVFASATFTAGAPVTNAPCSVIYSRENDVLELIAEDTTYRYADVLGGGAQWTASLVSIPEMHGTTFFNIEQQIHSYPQHIEIMNAWFDTPGSVGDNPNQTLGNRWTLDVRAYTPNNTTVIAQGYGKEYINQKTVETWTGWRDTDSASAYFVESSAVTNFIPGYYRTWVANHVEDAAHRVYTVEFFDLCCTRQESPTGSENTHFHLITNKTTDNKIIFNATVIEGGTATYPVGTKFRNVYDATDLSNPGWSVVTMNAGTIEVTDPITGATPASLYAMAQTHADRNTFTVFFDDVTFATSEGLNDHCHVEVVKTTDRAFMRISTRIYNDIYTTEYYRNMPTYCNVLWYTSLLNGSWTEYTKVNNPYLGQAIPHTTVNGMAMEFSQDHNWDDRAETGDFVLPSAKLIHKYIDRVTDIDDATDEDWSIPTCGAVTGYIDDVVGDIETILTTLTTGSGV